VRTPDGAKLLIGPLLVLSFEGSTSHPDMVAAISGAIKMVGFFPELSSLANFMLHEKAHLANSLQKLNASDCGSDGAL
jgi:hypothetical protein